MKLSQLSPDDRPREKLLSKGAGALSNTDLLAIILRTGTRTRNVLDLARDLLASNGNRLSVLASLEPGRLQEEGGIGPEKAASLTAVFELVRRIMAESPERDVTTITNADQVFLYMEPKLKGLDHEECWLLYLSKQLKLISAEKITSGTPTSTGVDIKMILSKALTKKAQKLIMVHNHPGGDPFPGEEDIRFTMALKSATQTAELMLIDHLIMGESCYYSFSEERLLNKGKSRYNKKTK